MCVLVKRYPLCYFENGKKKHIGKDGNDMIIDSHQHIMIPADLQLQKMDESGIDQAVLFATAPHPEKAEGLEDLKKEMAALNQILAGSNTKEANMYRMQKNIAELVQRIREYPDRFRGFGPVPFGLSIQETDDWLEQHIIGNGFCGVGEFTPGTEAQIRQLETVFQGISAYSGIPIWIHTFSPVTLPGLQILMEICRRYPKVPVIFGHMGGTNWMEVIEFAKEQREVYLDLSAAFASIATKTAIHELPERCLFSSDAPYGEPYLYRQLVEFVSPDPEVAALVLGKNMENLLMNSYLG